MKVASWIANERAVKAAEGKRRRQNAWIALGVALAAYLTFVSTRNLLW